ncbi:hypothetical protein ACHAWF_003628 [Thalassiosira exigua]
MATADASRLSLSDRPRPRKRQKSSRPGDPDDGAEAGSSGVPTPTLAPELWAHAVDFLPYPSVLALAATSRSMLRDVMPRVTALHLDRASQLHAGVARRRYRDVRDVHVYSLILYRQTAGGPFEDDRALDEDTATRAVPFLCSFPKLERAFLGGRRTDDGTVEGFVPRHFSIDEHGERMKALIDAFSGAFRAGALSSKLWVAGLRCPHSSRMNSLFRESSCTVCRNACRSFPLESVVDFENEGSSEYGKYVLEDAQYEDDLIYGLDVCLSKTQVHAIIKGRTGGCNMLYSIERFMNLLGRGTRHVIVTDHDEVLFVVKYHERELCEMKDIIKHSSFDVKSLTSHAVIDAIQRSFAGDERDPVPPREQCYLAAGSFYALKDMELPIDEGDFLNEDEWDGTKSRSKFPARSSWSYNWRFY